MEFLVYLGPYLTGLLIFWLLDGWFHWTEDMNDDDKMMFIVAWPLTMPYTLVMWLRSAVETARERRDQQVEEKRKIRIAAEKELQAQMRSIEEDLNNEKPSRKKSR